MWKNTVEPDRPQMNIQVWRMRIASWMTKTTDTLSEYTGYTQKNGAVSKVNKKFISQLTRAQRTPSAAATVQVSHALLAVRCSCLLRGRGASFQDGVLQKETTTFSIGHPIRRI